MLSIWKIFHMLSFSLMRIGKLPNYTAFSHEMVSYRLYWNEVDRSAGVWTCSYLFLFLLCSESQAEGGERWDLFAVRGEKVGKRLNDSKTFRQFKDQTRYCVCRLKCTASIHMLVSVPICTAPLQTCQLPAGRAALEQGRRRAASEAPLAVCGRGRSLAPEIQPLAAGVLHAPNLKDGWGPLGGPQPRRLKFCLRTNWFRQLA